MFCKKITVRSDGRVKMPEKMIEDLGIARGSIVEIFQFDDLIVVRKPYKPTGDPEMKAHFLEISTAMMLVKSRMLLLNLQEKDVVITGFPKGLFKQICTQERL